MGIGVGSRVLEGGHGSAGLAMHLANVMGEKGKLISIESRAEHATVGKENMERLRQILPEFPDWYLFEGDFKDSGNFIENICDSIDAAIIDIAEPWEIVPIVEKFQDLVVNWHAIAQQQFNLKDHGKLLRILE